MELNTGYAYVHDNLMGLNNKPFRINESNGGPNGDHNTITHNTLYSTTLHLNEDDDGACYNTITNNIIIGAEDHSKLGSCYLFPYSDKIGYSTNTFDYNLYNSVNVVYHNKNSYTLDGWKTFSQQDRNSMVGSPVFINTSGSMTQIADFALAVNSPGKSAASVW